LKFLYLIVAFFSTTIGAISGLGGGVIIKPVLDAIGQYDVATIGMLSTFTVFSMAVVSSIKQYAGGIRFEGKRTVYISLGSVLGGFAGKYIFSTVSAVIEQRQYITAIQSLILALLLILVLYYLTSKNIQNLNIGNRVIIFSAGFALGIAASFLGVGGGPFNVVLLSLLFSMDSRSAAVHSVLIILFSQSAKILAILFDTGFAPYNLSMLIYMIPGGIAGGFIGSSLNQKMKRKTIQQLFKIIVIIIIVLNLYNLVMSLI